MIYYSIITDERHKCYLCGSTRFIEIHHIFSNANRGKSTKYGLVVPLCRNCHRGSNGVHHNYSKMLELRKIGQQAFMEKYLELDFLEIFGRNYL